MKLVKEQLEFDFSHQPLNRYKSVKGPKGSPIENKRKQKMGLNATEEEQLTKLYDKLHKVDDELDNLEANLSSLEEEYEYFVVEESQEEEFYADIINNYGEEMLDMLNSGLSYEEKQRYVRSISKKANDTGDESPEERALDNYEYFYKRKLEIEKNKEILPKKIKALKNIIKEKIHQKYSIEDKIYNLEHF